MTAVNLRRVDPAPNMRRFYRLDMQPELFGGVLLAKEGDASARTGAWWPSLTTVKRLPPTPCSDTSNVRGAADTCLRLTCAQGSKSLEFCTRGARFRRDVPKRNPWAHLVHSRENARRFVHVEP